VPTVCCITVAQNIKDEEAELRELQAKHGVDGQQHAKPAKAEKS